jgi:hypothetical protein
MDIVKLRDLRKHYINLHNESYQFVGRKYLLNKEFMKTTEDKIVTIARVNISENVIEFEWNDIIKEDNEEVEDTLWDCASIGDFIKNIIKEIEIGRGDDYY